MTFNPGAGYCTGFVRLRFHLDASNRSNDRQSNALDLITNTDARFPSVMAGATTEIDFNQWPCSSSLSEFQKPGALWPVD